ncbi:hypothetical protein GPECTOR_51g710 [Gonium pectorale]|uniref:Glycosyltransferase n=1 Tax=Gonium pectorale TaxID=33097 RepID=A0A150G7B1_GONPE|nr:hypothetical protein GPECTOR_51g710 [Gonium pectorale]|eukprot:KXZ45724.1 hypothetical protein GPECTOR_51g710 [Gonium pectorale]
MMLLLGALLLLLGGQPTCANDTPTNVSLPDLANSFWTPNGLKLPSKELVDAVNKAKLPVLDSLGHKRQIVLMSIASEFAFQKMFDVFLTSLANITFARPDGSQDNLAKHLVINVMTMGTNDRCRDIAGKYGSICVSFANPSFTMGNFHVFSNDFYGIGFTKTATILDGLTLGVDVLFLDADQIMLRNPLPYLLAREADILVSGDCHNHEDASPMERLPPINNNIGFVYFRPTAMVTRAVYNWALWLANIARSGGKPWDQTTFAGAIEWVSGEVTVRHLSMAMLHSDLFPYLCMVACLDPAQGPCGCDLRGVPYFHNGRLPRKRDDGTCDPELMKEWYNYHFPCAGDMNFKAQLMQEYTEMYQKVIGPVNSRSAPMTVLAS